MTRERKQNKRKLKSNFPAKQLREKLVQSVYVFTMLQESLFTGAHRQNFQRATSNIFKRLRTENFKQQRAHDYFVINQETKTFNFYDFEEAKSSS